MEQCILMMGVQQSKNIYHSVIDLLPAQGLTIQYHAFTCVGRSFMWRSAEIKPRSDPNVEEVWMILHLSRAGLILSNCFFLFVTAQDLRETMSNNAPSRAHCILSTPSSIDWKFLKDLHDTEMWLDRVLPCLHPCSILRLCHVNWFLRVSCTRYVRDVAPFHCSQSLRPPLRLPPLLPSLPPSTQWSRVESLGFKD